MRHLMRRHVRVSRSPPSPRLPAPPRRRSRQAQHDATHAMFEHVDQYPDRDRAPSTSRRWRNIVADQFKAGGFPAADIHVMPYHTESATTGDDDTAALIVRWRAAGKPNAQPILLMGHMDVVEAKRRGFRPPTRS